MRSTKNAHRTLVNLSVIHKAIKQVNLQEFLQQGSLAALLITFANAKPHKNGFVIESSYRHSNYSNVQLTDECYHTNNQLLTNFSGLSFELIGIRHQFVINTRYDTDQFFTALYREIQKRRVEEQVNDNEFSNLILICFFALRGSPDFKLNFYSLDLPRQIVTQVYLDLLFKLLTNITDLRQLNLNFRELQQQYTSGENQRNTQFRINLRYFYEHCRHLLAAINRYKYDILEENNHLILSRNISQKSNSFLERLIFYKDNVLNKKSTENEIELLRKELGFIYEQTIDETIKRNQGIVQYARILLDDECVACKDQYPILDRTFRYRNSDRLYLEIHHVISFSSDRTLDQIDNLVKLCPTCHRALTRYRADENHQKLLIQNILANAPTAKAFCLNFVDEMNCVQFIYDRLK